MSTKQELLSEKASIQDKINANEESIRHLTKANHWHKKHLKLIEAQIEETDEEATNGQSAAEVLMDVSKGLK